MKTKIEKMVDYLKTCTRNPVNCGWLCTDGGAKYHISGGTVTGVSNGSGSNCRWRDADERMTATVERELLEACRHAAREKMVDRLVDAELAGLL